MASYALGLDYGTNSVRALLVNVEDGNEVATATFPYPSGVAGVVLDPKDPNLARQHPKDYIDGFIAVVREVLRVSQVPSSEIIGIGVDTTGSSPMPVDAQNQPLSYNFEQRKTYTPEECAALTWLWKDHTSFSEASQITNLAESMALPYLSKCGGTYSSEWFWSKILHCAHAHPTVFEQAYSWVEIADWVPGWICGVRDVSAVKRGICGSGHKAMFHSDWGGLPSEQFLTTLDPRLGSLRSRLFDVAVSSDQIAGHLSPEYASLTGLPVGIPVAVGAFDAHMGAVASGVRPGVLVKIIGTSTCDCMVHPLSDELPDVPGLCGIVPGSILPGMYGLEAGQSAVGDIFNWFVKELGIAGHEALSAIALTLKPGQSGLLALDWNNGNRTILVDPRLSGMILGLSLHSTSAEIYRALIEATAFGALTIIRRLEEYGVAVDEVVNCGGISEKSVLTMQIYADVCNRPMKVSRSAQTCALGAAIFGSVVGGGHASVSVAQAAMTGVKDKVFLPNPDSVKVYARLYKLYRELHDSFGGVSNPSLGHLMKDLLDLRDETRG